MQKQSDVRQNRAYYLNAKRMGFYLKQATDYTAHRRTNGSFRSRFFLSETLNARRQLCCLYYTSICAECKTFAEHLRALFTTFRNPLAPDTAYAPYTAFYITLRCKFTA